ncbi:beta-glucosidase [Pseudoxanthomonas sp. 3HH-4]|uniref:glycoside hydrolase family 3 N-terminal domain-containing protein n=1 Tax=Pseudoxanthomonas sp. 3HH-4 TaxID=1690214 RepID=UPI001151E143|nr:glycoside hydrolase family 3 N-terminal domain-containing protein [Pseudoxanthomonas sp. 3HH-4]TQM12478.1 beta-glucosidase [Pseudoxanthomonas sp. 3HH-4]
MKHHNPRIRHALLAGLVVTLLAATAAARPPVYATPAEKTFVDALLAKMTVEEKLGQLNQPPGVGNNTGPAAMAGNEDQIRRGEIGSYLGTQGAVLTCRLQKIAVEESRLGIPLLFGYDVIHGHRTVFPVPLGESASFDPAEVQHAARVAAIEASAHGIHWTYAPMVDIARDPRWGRVVEGAGEDPYLGSVLAAARVRGFQGEDLRAPDAVLATAKHFVAYGAAEAGRDYNVADISERTLHELYLPPFKAAVDAGAQSIMAAFNEIAGVPMHAHQPLIEDLLRKQWGWDGLLVSDYTGVMELMPHGVAADREQAGLLGLRAGVDVDMVSQIYVKDLPAAVKAGRIPMAQLDASVRRVLNAKYRLGLFDDPYRSCTDDGARERALTLTPQHRADARRMAQKSLVLLENDNQVLPLSKSVRTLAVIGPLADHRRAMLGNWAVAGREEDAVTPLEGLKASLGDKTRLVVAKGADIDSQDTRGFADAVAAAKQADAVVMFLGEHPDMSAEANNRTSLDLPGVQEQLALAVAATGKPVVVVLLNGRPLSIGGLKGKVSAILEAWFPGIEGGHAIADVLFGDVNPSAKLPITFPHNVGQVPIYYAHKNTGRPPRTEEKYTSKYLDVPWTPLYAFGYGLSYTTFRYDVPVVSSATLKPDALEQQVSVRVTNTGKRAGDEVVQLYVRDDVATITRPVKQLRGFQRVSLQPGESKTVTFTLGFDDLAMYDARMQQVVEPGTFTVFVGGSSDHTQQATFTVGMP